VAALYQKKKFKDYKRRINVYAKNKKNRRNASTISKDGEWRGWMKILPSMKILMRLPSVSRLMLWTVLI